LHNIIDPNGHIYDKRKKLLDHTTSPISKSTYSNDNHITTERISEISYTQA